ncbi:CaiB/BaiF CoA transferase family protein [Corynebacterium sp. S7]
MLDQSLKGIKVLDLSRIMAGPWCTQNLADLGADVLKVENTGRGDDTRGWGAPYLEGTSERDGFSSYFTSANRGKRSLSIDFADPEGAKIVQQLVSEADIVVENFKAGTLARYGLSYDQLVQSNSELIYISITGFGQNGPLSTQPGYDYVFQGMGGLMSYTGLPDGQPGAMPLRAGIPIIDISTGMYATAAVLAALFQRTTTGKGQYIDIALLDVAVALNANQGANYLLSNENPKRSGNVHPNCAPYEVFETADGFIILAIGNDAQFRKFCATTNYPELESDPRFLTNSQRLSGMSELRPILREIMKRKTNSQWQADLDAAGVAWGPINNLSEVFENPQVKHRQLRVDVVHPEHGRIPIVRNPLTAAHPDAIPTQAPPAKGEHSRLILSQLGIPADEIQGLFDSGIVAEYERESPQDIYKQGSQIHDHIHSTR